MRVLNFSQEIVCQNIPRACQTVDNFLELANTNTWDVTVDDTHNVKNKFFFILTKT
jgi:hypothetical protein